MNIWNDLEAQKFFSSERQKQEDLYLGEKFFLSKVLFEHCSILDIGCAQGGLYKILKSYLKSFNYTGIDSSEKMISKAKKKYPKANFHLIKNNDFKKLKKKYNIVIIYGVLHLTSEWKQILINSKNLFKNFLIFDLRETNLKTIDNNISKSYLSFSRKKKIKLPYNIINSNEAAFFLKEKFRSNIYKFSYFGKISNFAKSKINNVEFTNYCISKKKL
jgi:2-polyprenyl-3-methyl-5-hydroxy-6-metoxy-1,4-benzoquinol methylase